MAGLAAVQAAIRLARVLTAPLVFVYVRRGPPSALGEPHYQRRLDAEMIAGRRAINHALAIAERARVSATGEQLAGDPARGVVEFCPRPRRTRDGAGLAAPRLGRSVSRGVIRSSELPVLVAGRTAPVAARPRARSLSTERGVADVAPRVDQSHHDWVSA
jgi:nucleotide-binding universal stress UspA family protein